MSQEAIVMGKSTHMEVRALFREFQKSSTTKTRRGELVDQAIELLSAHADVEDDVVYPHARVLTPPLQEDVPEP